jgi:chaperonin cofactor prefoldin
LIFFFLEGKDFPKDTVFFKSRILGKVNYQYKQVGKTLIPFLFSKSLFIKDLIQNKEFLEPICSSSNLMQKYKNQSKLFQGIKYSIQNPLTRILDLKFQIQTLIKKNELTIQALKKKSSVFLKCFF